MVTYHHWRCDTQQSPTWTHTQDKCQSDTTTIPNTNTTMAEEDYDMGYGNVANLKRYLLWPRGWSWFITRSSNHSWPLGTYRQRAAVCTWRARAQPFNLEMAKRSARPKYQTTRGDTQEIRHKSARVNTTTFWTRTNQDATSQFDTTNNPHDHWERGFYAGIQLT